MKKPAQFDEIMNLVSSLDDASKPYDGPVTMWKATLKSRMADIAARRKRMEELYGKGARRRPVSPDWEKIESFLGYGNVNAPIVFVGMEEGLADKDKLESDLKYRSAFAEPVKDVYEAHLGLAKGKQLFGDRPRGQGTWRVMADLMLHFEGELPKDKAERAKLRKQYRANVLGDEDDLSLLLELLPLPHGNIKQWLYRRFDRYKTREEYEARVMDGRVAALRKVIESHPRKAIICYGHKNWNEFKRLFPEVKKWEQRDDFLCAKWEGANVTLTNHFVSRSFNADWQLDELAAVAFPKNA